MASFGSRVRNVAARARYAVDLVDEFGTAFEAGRSQDVRIELQNAGARSQTTPAPGASPLVPLALVALVVLMAWG